jgi:hypothetical protein
MRSLLTILLTIAVFGAISWADYAVSDRGEWPNTWPKELDSVRDQACTLVGPKQLFRLYEIPFAKREEFEAAWPHLLKVKAPGAPVILTHPPIKAHIKNFTAGVFIHSPPEGTADQPPRDTTVVRDRWLYSTYIELVVDGQIVDLNRIQLPKDTPIVDERFDAQK